MPKKKEAAPSLRVGMNQCATAPPGTTLSTMGLATCIGVCAYGHAGVGGYNKVIAHMSTMEQTQSTYVMSQFETYVAGLQSCTGVVVSVPDRTVMDETYKEELRQQGYSRRDITEAVMEASPYRALIDDANQRLYAQLVSLGINTRVKSNYTRRNRDINRSNPYGSIVASASPGGMVMVEGSYVDDIPDPIEQAGPSGSTSGGGGGASGGYSGGGGYGLAYGTRSSAPSSGGQSGGGGYGGQTGYGRSSGTTGLSTRPSGGTTAPPTSTGGTRRTTTTTSGNSLHMGSMASALPDVGTRTKTSSGTRTSTTSGTRTSTTSGGRTSTTSGGRVSSSTTTLGRRP